MLPILFKIGNFPVHSFGVMMAIAFFSGLWLVKTRAKAYEFDPNEVSDVAFWTLLAGVLGARIVFILQELPSYLANPKELFSLQFQGLTSFGGLIFGAVVLIGWAIKKKLSVLSLLDLVAPAFVLGHAIGRIGCLLNGCCYGGVCDPTFPLGVHVDGSPLLHYPAQVYDSAMNLMALAFLLWLEKRNVPRGVELGSALILHGFARFIYEFARAGSSSTYWGSLPITQAHAMALVLIVIGAFVNIRQTSANRARRKLNPQP